MDILDWSNLVLRWFHLVVAIGWIGVSLYFMWLDAQITPPSTAKPGVEGELWMVHSGGFYHVEKRQLGPRELPKVLHWFKWEAGLTGISGFLLLTVVYYMTGGIFLVDRTVSAISPGAATALGIGLLIVGWLVYDALWASPLGRDHAGPANVISSVLLFGAAYGLCRALSGRAAYIHLGAMLGIIMVANVWMRILPAQRELIAATAAGRAPDPTLGTRAKQRSVHNSYLTFPVIFMMVSHHYPATYGHALNWLILCLLIVVGAGIRHLLILHESHRFATWVWAPVGASLAVIVYLTSPAWLSASPASSGGRVAFPVAKRIVDLRCASCHSQSPTDDVFRVAPNGVTFDSPDTMRARADAIKLRTVLSQSMPPGNKTGMTREERDVLGRWIDQGARVE